MSQITNPSLETTAINRRHAWVAVLLVFAAICATLVLGFIYTPQVGAVTLNPPVVLLAAAVIGYLVGIVFMLRGQFERGVYVSLAALMVFMPLTSFWLAGRGLILGVGIGFSVVLVATLALPPNRAQWFIVLGIFAGLVTIGLDVLGSPERIALTTPQAAGAVIIGVLALTFAFFVALNFANYPLRIKLLLAFVSVALLSVGGVTFVASQAIRNSLTEHSAEDLADQARNGAVAVGLVMDRNIDRLETFSLNKSVQLAVAEMNDAVQRLPQRDAFIQQNGERWASANPDEQVIRNALNSELAYSLRQFGDVFQGNENIFVTDSFGSIIAAADWQPVYNYARDGWWQIAYNDGKGSVYLGQPEFDPMMNGYGLRIALPIYASGRERVVGVVHAIFSLTALRRALLLNSFGDTGKVDLLFPQGQILTSEGSFRLLTFDEFTEIQDAISTMLPTLNYRGEPLLSSQGVVGVSDEQPEPYLRSTAWRTIATVQAGEALAIVDAGTRAATLAGLAAVGIAIVGALLLAGFLTRPIRRLTLVAEQVQHGDLGARAVVTSTDEIGTLSRSFNNMTTRLQDTLVGLERRVAERTQELTNANLLLQSNAAYLSALSDTSTGLFQRLDVNELLQAIVERAAALVGTQHGFVFFQEPGENDIEMRVGVGLYDDLIGTHAQPGIGLAGTVWQTGAPMIIDDYQKWEGRLPGTRRDALRAIVAVPLKRGAEGGAHHMGETVGVIGLAFTEEGRRFGKTEVDILQRFSQLASIALDNARLYSTSEERVQELAALNSVSQLVSTESDLDKLIEKAGDQICRIFGTDFAYVALYDPATEMIEFPYVVDEGKRTEIPKLPMGQGLTSQVISTRQPMLLNGMNEQAYERMGAVDTGDGASPVALLSVPLLSGEKVLGVLSVQRTGAGRIFTLDDQRLLSTLAASLGVGIDNARLYANLESHVQELALLNRVGELVSSALPLNERLTQAGEAVREFFRVPSVYISLYDPEARTIYTPYFYGGDRLYPVPPVPDTRGGFASMIIHSRSPLLINGQLKERMHEAGAREIGEPSAKSYLGAPILYGNDVLGVIGMSDESTARFNDADLNLLTTLAAALGSAIQNAKLFERTESALAQSDALYQVVREIAASRDVQGVLASMAHGMDLPFINRLVLYELEQDAEGELVAAVVGGNWYSGAGNAAAAPGTRLDLEQLAPAKKFFGMSPLQIDDLSADARLGSGAREIAQRLRAATLAAIPLLVGARLIGTLFLEGDEPHAWQEQEIEPLVSIAGAVAVAVNNFRLLAETRAALAETQRLAARERESSEQLLALNRRLTREGWRDFLEQLGGRHEVEVAEVDEAYGDGMAAVPAEPEGDTNGHGKIKVPIALRGEVIGEIELEPESDAHPISEDELGLVTHVAENIGLALDNVRLYSETQRRVTELDALNRISQAVTTELELDALLNVIGDQVREIFDVQNVYIALYDRKTQMIALPYFINDNKRAQVEPIHFGEGITSEIIRTRRPLVMNERTDQKMAELGAKVYGNPARSYLGVPIFVGDEVTGVISIQNTSREGVFDEGNVRLLETIAATIGAAIQNAQLYGAMQREVVERQRAEEEIKLSLKEKEVLLKEIHHRVKNNLQIITSLLNLQSAQIKDPATLTMFRESQARVRSMALIHEKLYQSKDLARIDFDGYVRDLMVYLFRSYAANPDQIRTEIDTSNLLLGIDTAIPCGLIISELVTNSMKYAFPDGRRGHIYIGLHPHQDGNMTLRVADDGIGLEEGFDWRESDSLGLQLVSTLTSQLHGTMQVGGKGGASFVLTFPG